MIRAMQIGDEVLVMRWDEVDGKVHNLQMRCMPIGVYMNLVRRRSLPANCRLKTDN